MDFATYLLGMRLTLYLGPTIAVPAPLLVAEALSGVEVRTGAEGDGDAGRDAFQLTFRLGRGPTDILDYPLLANPLLKPFNRCIVQVWTGVIPHVLIDGMITHHQVDPGEEPGSGTLTVTGEDLRVLMSLKELSLPHPQMPPNVRVETILARYAAFFGGKALVIPTVPPYVEPATQHIPVQGETDLQYVEWLAADHDYVFYVEPTPVPNVNMVYWGPENRLGLPQRALSINVGPESNATIRFGHDALGPQTVLGAVTEKRTGVPVPVATFASTRTPLAALPSILVGQPYVRSVQARESAGLSPPRAFARAQAQTDRSADALDAQGELDALRYGDILRPRRLVGVRGAGWLLDGHYYVKQVTHVITKGEYKQRFTLTRDGLGSLTPVVRP